MRLLIVLMLLLTNRGTYYTTVKLHTCHLPRDWRARSSDNGVGVDDLVQRHGTRARAHDVHERPVHGALFCRDDAATGRGRS